MSKVLIIDDDAVLLEITTEDLRLAGYEVISASSGIQALQVIRDSLPDIVVCDINMPDMDGYEVLATLRDDSATASIPFIFLTALSEQSEIREGMEKGADDYLVKPVQIDSLIQAINTRLLRLGGLQMSRLREYAHRLVITQETERRGFASSLKDNLAEKLSDLKISLEMLSRLQAANPTLHAASKLAAETLNTINGFAYELWPSVLNHLGLEAALLSLFDQVQMNSDFQISFEYYGLEAITDADFAILLYRIIQEAIINVKQHANVNSVSLKLWLEENRLHLQIEDKGQGFDVQTALSTADTMGLLSMMERAFLLNGDLNILSTPGEGTRIYGNFPLRLQKIKAPQMLPSTQKAANQSQLILQQSSRFSSLSNETLIRVVIAEPNELSRWGYKGIIESDSRFKVVSEIAAWVKLLRFLEDVPVDILLISHALSGEQNGLLQLQQLQDKYPTMRILLLSNYSESTFASEALKNGVSGYLLKSCGREEILDALYALSEGQQYIAIEIVAAKHGKPSSIKTNSQIEAFTTLTEREREVFYRVVNGQTNQQIADELYISSRTVESHRTNMMRKLGVTGFPALINFAVHKGLLDKNS